MRYHAAMTHYKTVLSLYKKSDIPKDAVQLSLHYRTTSGVAATATEKDNFSQHIMHFLDNVVTGATANVGYYLSNAIKRTADAHLIQFYEMPGSRGPLGVAVDERATSMYNGGAGTEIPAEVAMCLSFHGAYDAVAEHGTAGARPKARWRNRVFLGPLTTQSIATDGTTKEVRVSNTAADDVTKACKHELLEHMLTSGWQWEVFSPTDWAWHDVVGGWCDNAYDTQRRRGVEATVRTTWAA